MADFAPRQSAFSFWIYIARYLVKNQENFKIQPGLQELRDEGGASQKP
jgi:hypothetical protein